jgi:NDP-sugar pyrophosphorylase family protein
MIEVAGRPFIFHQLEWLQREGVDRIVICVGYLGEMIRDAVKDGAKWGMSVDYSFDGERLLGTGGALRRALPKLENVFFVLYGDSYLSCSLANVGRAFMLAKKPALMTIIQNNGKWGVSNVHYEGKRVLRYDKRNPTHDMKHIDYGLCVVSAAALASKREGEAFDLADALATLSVQNELAGFEVTERFYEIGSPEGLKEAEKHLSRIKKQ